MKNRLRNGDVHTQGTIALVGVARAAINALKVAVRDVETDPKNAHRGIALQANLISKTVTSLSAKIDHLPKDAQPKDDQMETALAVNIDDVTDALSRIKKMALGTTCHECGLVLPDAA